jgi:long-chain acyl-CoA synthetase
MEIKNYLNSTGSVMIVMVDMCYEKIKNILHETKVYKSIYVSPKESMPFFMGLGYEVTKGFKMAKPDKNDTSCISWSSFIRDGKRYHMSFDSMTKKDDPAVILHSGGTTGSPKSIVLSSSNFNALVEQAKIMLKDVLPGDKILGVLPIFHGFGLGVTMHCAVAKGVEIQLIPQFDVKKFGKILTKDRPNLIMGVPTLFEAMTSVEEKGMDLSYLKYVVCGGDSLNQSLIDKVNNYLHEHNGRVRICQGYGMTECLGAVCVGFKNETNRDLSMGIPLPGDYLKIVDPKTLKEMPIGEAGEICVSGPTVMIGYLDNPKETNSILRIHSDGRIWLHTGDMGYMNDEGIFYYQQRIKRMIISSGFNVYPNQIESVICEHEAVLNCTVIAIPHPYKQQVAKAFVVLKPGYSDNIFTRNSIKEHCKKHLAKFALPYEYEFR